MFKSVFSKFIASVTFVALMSVAAIPTAPAASATELLETLEDTVVETVVQDGLEHEFTIDFDAEEVELVSEDGYQEVLSFDEIEALFSDLATEFAATEFGAEFLSENGYEDYVPSETVIDSSDFQKSSSCKVAARISGLLNSVAWRVLIQVVGMHPLVRLITTGGHAAFWAWIRYNC